MLPYGGLYGPVPLRESDDVNATPDAQGFDASQSGSMIPIPASVGNMQADSSFSRNEYEGSTHEGNSLANDLGYGRQMCPICLADMHFWLLNRHVEMEHMPDKRPHCTECNKDFLNTKNLIIHYREIHVFAEVRNFPCQWPDCGKSFKRLPQANSHYRAVHLKEKDYICGYCDNEYAKVGELKKHLDLRHPYDGAAPHMKR